MLGGCAEGRLEASPPIRKSGVKMRDADVRSETLSPNFALEIGVGITGNVEMSCES